jgi:hypothetical protein
VQALCNRRAGAIYRATRLPRAIPLKTNAGHASFTFWRAFFHVISPSLFTVRTKFCLCFIRVLALEL